MDVTVKTFYKPPGFADHEVRRLVLKEASIMLNLPTHFSLPKLIGVAFNSDRYALVSSFHGIERKSTTIHSVLTKHDIVLSKKDWLGILYALTNALVAVHNSGYFHGDLKTDNVIVTHSSDSEFCKFSCVVIDYGKSCLAVTSKFHAMLSKDERIEYRHKFPWVETEVMNCERVLSSASDVYAYGYIANRIKKHGRVKSSRLNELVAGCLMDNPAERITLSRVMTVINGHV